MPAGAARQPSWSMTTTVWRCLAKLVEEAQKAANAGPGELVTELADLLEVVDATISAHGLLPDDVEEERLRRRSERERFEAQIRLL